MKNILTKTKKIFNLFLRRYGYFYGINIIIIGIVFGIFFWLKSYMPPYKIDYKPKDIQSVVENSGRMNTKFHYYLDFSPSMEGFFKEGIDSSMKAVANTFREINTSGNEKQFFYCTDKIRNITEDALYRNMESSLEIRAYYDAIITGNGMGTEEEQNQNLQNVINNINLVNIFSPQYREYEGYKIGEENLNVIITDFNFKKNTDDIEGQNILIKEFAQYFAQTCAESNIAIYHFSSNFAGITSDEYELEAVYEVGKELQSFFVIVESQNDTAYGNFIEKLELKLTQQGIDCSEKYELVNRVSDRKKELDISLNSIRNNGWIELNNFNYNESAFQEVKPLNNTIGLGLVQGNGIAYLNMYTSLIEIIGCNNTEQTLTGDVQIEVKTKVSYFKDEEYKQLEENIISSLKFGTIWEKEKMYLTMELEMEPNNVKSIMEDIYKDDFLHKYRLLQERYLVIELQCFLKKPDYSLPAWTVNNKNIQDKIEVYNYIIESKEAVFANLSEEQRYIGSVILYIIY